MEIALQLLCLILGGLFLGQWLEKEYHASPLLTIFLPILGLVLGIMMAYKQTLRPKSENNKLNDSSKPIAPLPPESDDFDGRDF
ncbi:MAG: AtpZ/AtpI family protein [Cyanobacteria bacterium]|nr:AtpZ/AtpI family protein [Cyanobacteriota bacterium]